MFDLTTKTEGVLATFDALVDDARHYAKASRAPNTRRAYETAWQQFNAFCSSHGLQALPAEAHTLAAFVAHLAKLGRKPSTIDTKLAGVAWFHRQAGHSFDTRLMSATVQGFKRQAGTAQRKASALLTDDIRAMVETCEDDLKGKRDRALILLGYASAMRRSEIVGLDVALGGDGGGYIEFTNEGLLITLTKSKTDQMGDGQSIAIPFAEGELCPVTALRVWLDASGIEDGAIFRGFKNRHTFDAAHLLPTRMIAQTIDRTVKSRAKSAGLMQGGRPISAHSLRSGFATEAARGGADISMMQQQTRHTKVETLLGYIREADRFGPRNASRRLGL